MALRECRGKVSGLDGGRALGWLLKKAVERVAIAQGSVRHRMKAEYSLTKFYIFTRCDTVRELQSA